MVKICTYNARGLRDFCKRKQLFLLLKHKEYDVIFIQESHLLDNELHLWRNQWGGEILCSNGTSNSKGVLILFKRKLQYEIKNVIKDTNGRYLVLEIVIEETELILVNVYAPNNDSPEFF